MLASNRTSDQRAILVKYAANILSRRPYFRHQLRQKLFLYSEKKNFEPSTSLIETIITDLAKSGYLDDQYLADAYVRRQLQKCYGPKIIRYKLKLLGLSEDIIRQSLAQEANKEALEIATERLKTKFRAQDPRKLRQKLYQRGF